MKSLTGSVISNGRGSASTAVVNQAARRASVLPLRADILTPARFAWLFMFFGHSMVRFEDVGARYELPALGLTLTDFSRSQR